MHLRQPRCSSLYPTPTRATPTTTITAPAATPVLAGPHLGNLCGVPLFRGHRRLLPLLGANVVALGQTEESLAVLEQEALLLPTFHSHEPVYGHAALPAVCVRTFTTHVARRRVRFLDD